MSKGVISMGIPAPIIKEGDNLISIIVDSILNATLVNTKLIDYQDKETGEWKLREEKVYDISDKDVIGITESVVARALGQYVTVDEIAADIKKKFGDNATIAVACPIYSRNRFAPILRGIARAAKKILFVMPEYDEVGNPRGVNPFTGVDIEKYYQEICEQENCECTFNEDWGNNRYALLDCTLHSTRTEKPTKQVFYRLDEICADKSPDWGLLGTNKSTEERLKLFPSVNSAHKLCQVIKKELKKRTKKDVIVCVYGDGCFKDPVGGIWEFADPVTMPAYTDWELIESTPNEIKLKAYIDEGKSQEEIDQLIKEKQDLTGSMSAQGTTPRIIRDLLASLMDLTSGSGDRGTPIVLVKNYFR